MSIILVLVAIVILWDVLVTLHNRHENKTLSEFVRDLKDSRD